MGILPPFDYLSCNWQNWQRCKYQTAASTGTSSCSAAPRLLQESLVYRCRTASFHKLPYTPTPSQSTKQKRRLLLPKKVKAMKSVVLSLGPQVWSSNVSPTS